MKLMKVRKGLIIGSIAGIIISTLCDGIGGALDVKEKIDEAKEENQDEETED